MFTTDQYESMIAETVGITGADGDTIHAYLARPLGPGPFPAVVLDPPHARLGRVLLRGDAQVRAPRLHRHLPRPLLPRRARHARGRGGEGARRRRRGRRPHGRRYVRRRRLRARAALGERQGRHHRQLLRRPPRLPRRLPDDRLRCGGRPLGRRAWSWRPRTSTQKTPVAPIDYDEGPLVPAARPLRRRGPQPDAGDGRAARGGAEAARQGATSSTTTRAPATASSTRIPRCTGRSRPSTAGRRCSTSSASTSAEARSLEGPPPPRSAQRTSHPTHVPRWYNSCVCLRRETRRRERGVHD